MARARLAPLRGTTPLALATGPESRGARAELADLVEVETRRREQQVRVERAVPDPDADPEAELRTLLDAHSPLLARAFRSSGANRHAARSRPRLVLASHPLTAMDHSTR